MKKTILLVDDDVFVLNVLTEMIETSSDHLVVTAGCAENAIEFVETSDVIVTDINLGIGMNGFDFGRLARKMKTGVPIVYMSGRPSNFYNHKLLNSEYWISKPFKIEQLLRLTG